MKKWIFLLLSLASQAFGQNLITNGNFELGSFDGWSASDGVTIVSGTAALSGAFSANVNQNSDYSEGTLSQDFPTTPGVFYLLKWDISDSWVDCAVTSSTGDTLLTPYPNSGGFLATSATSTITFSSYGGAIDNVSVQAVSFSKPGKYTGTVTYGCSFPDLAGVKNSRKYGITARIDANGRLAGVIGDGTSICAIVQNNGVLATDWGGPLISGSVNPTNWAISFTTQSSDQNNLTGLNEVRTSTVSLKYAGK